MKPRQVVAHALDRRFLPEKLGTDGPVAWSGDRPQRCVERKWDRIDISIGRRMMMSGLKYWEF
jgi:hypothetical protein